MQNNLLPYDYGELRDAIHDIFYNFLDWELKCAESGEFDFEWMEYKTDDILHLIIRQGGQY